MLLVVGLGNPGQAYAGNRHNIGFMAVDEIVRRHGFSPWRKKFHGEIADGIVAGEKVVALKPETYMNDSGRAVQAAMTFYKVRPEDVLVFHDEIDLASGKLRVKRGGGHAGHNGLRSIHAHVGPDYGRVRMGVGHPGDKNQVKTYVLKDFAKADAEWLEPMLDGCAEFLAHLLRGEDGDYMSKVAHRIKPNRPNAPNPAQSSQDGPDGDTAKNKED